MAIRVSVPSSKSYTQRALVLAALAPGQSVVRRPADCDDARVLVKALGDLGVDLSWDAPEAIRVRGGGPLEAPPGPVHLENAGTAVRFVTGLSALVRGSMVIDGVEAMRRRPMPGLLRALEDLGVSVEEQGRPGCPPVRLERRSSRVPERVDLDAAGSSQQLSALLLAAPRLERGLVIELSSELPSRPYVDMTLAAIRAFGGRADWVGPGALRVEPGGLAGREYEVEGDWSGAAMVLAGAWIRGIEVHIDNLPAESLQGDRVFTEVLAALSAEGPRAIDLGDAPDVVPPAVAAALFAEGATRFEGIGHLRIKESDRMAVLAGELAKVGADIECEDDAMTVRPRPLSGSAALDPHGDHRMAMAFGLARLRVPGIEVLDQGCVSKSFSDFWSVLEALG